VVDGGEKGWMGERKGRLSDVSQAIFLFAGRLAVLISKFSLKKITRSPVAVINFVKTLGSDQGPDQGTWLKAR
jgi:hypothetical protein